ncbi:MAG: hypothetical protein K2L74_00925, partial [Muribaculaceae bacterium]|nr:hypothetical protein [Muribaculaceae bacterium]
METIALICLAAAIAAAAYAIVADRRAARARAEADMARRMLDERTADAARAEERFRAIANEALLANARSIDAGARRN